MEDAIFTRVSIREFTDEPVSDEQIERLMEAAMAAPSAGNQQPWEFVLTRDSQVKEQLAACSPYAHPAGKCDLVIVPCISGGEKRFEGCVPLDMSACTENILLEAQALGLGAVWLGIYPEQDRIEAVAKVIVALAAASPSRSLPWDTPRRCSSRAAPSVLTCHAFAGYSEACGITT